MTISNLEACLPLIAEAARLTQARMKKLKASEWNNTGHALWQLIALDHNLIPRIGESMFLFAALIDDIVKKLQLEHFGKYLPTINPLPASAHNCHLLLRMCTRSMRFPIVTGTLTEIWEERLRDNLIGLKTKLATLLPEAAEHMPDIVDKNPALTFMFSRLKALKLKQCRGTSLSDLAPRLAMVRQLHDCLSRSINELAVVYSICLADCVRVEWMRRSPADAPRIPKPAATRYASEIVSAFYPQGAVGQRNTKVCSETWLQWLYALLRERPEIEADGKDVLEASMTVSDYARCVVSAMRLTDLAIQTWWARAGGSGGVDLVAVWKAILKENKGIKLWPVIVWKGILLMTVQGARAPAGTGTSASGGTSPSSQPDTDAAEAAGAEGGSAAEASQASLNAEDVKQEEPDGGDDGPKVEDYGDGDYPALLATLNDSLGYLACNDIAGKISAQMGVFSNRCRDMSALFPAGWVSPGRNWWQGYVGRLLLSSCGAVAVSRLFVNDCSNLLTVLNKLPFMEREIKLPLQYGTRGIPNALIVKWDGECAALFPTRAVDDGLDKTASDKLAHAGFPWRNSTALTGFLGIGVMTTYRPAQLCVVGGGSAGPPSDDFYKTVADCMVSWRKRAKLRDTSQRQPARDVKLTEPPWPWSIHKDEMKAENSRERSSSYRQRSKKRKKKTADMLSEESYSLPVSVCPTTRRSLPARQARGGSVSPHKLGFDDDVDCELMRSRTGSDEDIDDFSVYQIVLEEGLLSAAQHAIAKCFDKFDKENVAAARVALASELAASTDTRRFEEFVRVWVWACQRWPKRRQFRVTVCGHLLWS